MCVFEEAFCQYQIAPTYRGHPRHNPDTLVGLYTRSFVGSEGLSAFCFYVGSLRVAVEEFLVNASTFEQHQIVGLCLSVYILSYFSVLWFVDAVVVAIKL